MEELDIAELLKNNFKPESKPNTDNNDQYTRYRVTTEFEKNFFVEANAGSGKTTLLSKRFVSMIANDIPVTYIYLLTFTKKAVEEMRDRIENYIFDIISSDPYIKKISEEKKEEEIREAIQKFVNKANISTIDSFAYLFLCKYFTQVRKDICGKPPYPPTKFDIDNNKAACDFAWKEAQKNGELLAIFDNNLEKLKKLFLSDSKKRETLFSFIMDYDIEELDIPDNPTDQDLSYICLLHNKNTKSCKAKMEKVASPFWRMLQLHQNRLV